MFFVVYGKGMATRKHWYDWGCLRIPLALPNSFPALWACLDEDRSRLGRKMEQGRAKKGREKLLVLTFILLLNKVLEMFVGLLFLS